MKRPCRLFALPIVLMGSIGWAQDLPPDLALVPGDAVGFVHVRVADLWKQEALKAVRQIIEKAGPQYLQMLDDRFVPAPSTIDRVTLFVGYDEKRKEPSALAAVTTNRPFDREKLLKQSLQTVEIKAGNSVFHFDAKLNLAVHVANDRMLLIGSESMMATYLQRTDKSHGIFASALREAAGGNPLTVAINTARIPEMATKEIPAPFHALLKNGLWQFSIEAGKSPIIHARVSFDTDAAADDGEKALKTAFDQAKQMIGEYRKQGEEALFGEQRSKRTSLEDVPGAAAGLAALGLANHLEEMLAGLTFKRDGKALAATVTVPEGPYATVVTGAGLMAGLALPAVQKVRDAAARMKSSNNLKQIGLALHNYSATYNDALPPAAICDKQGKPLLSWRVAILPFIEQQALYSQFKLDEPWDSEHNIKLARVRVPVYTHPNNVAVEEFPTTLYQAFVGNGSAWELKSGMKMPASFLDGTSNTIWVVEAEKGVPWTKPDDISYDPKKKPPVGFHLGSVCVCLFVDGSVRAITRNVPESTWHLLIQRADGMVIPDFDK